MADIAARLDLASRRNEARTLTIRVVGADWSQLAWRQQVRMQPNAPGSPVLNIAQVGNANEEGLFVVGVAQENGVPVTTVRLRYNMTTMRDQIPYAGEIGDDAKFAHAIQVGGVTRLAGDWWAVASAIDSDTAPVGNGFSGFGQLRRAPGVTSSIGLTIVQDQIVTITIDGVEQVAALVAAAKTEADRAEAASASAAQQIAVGTAAAIAQTDARAAAAAAAAASAEGVRGQVVAIRDTFANTVATAQAAVLAAANGQYLTISSGLAATAPNGFFYVASGGDVFTTLYQKVNGAAVLINLLPSRAALDRVGRYLPGVVDQDNAASINAALADALVSGTLLPGGDIRLDDALRPGTSKFIRGAGKGVTRLVRTDRYIGNGDARDSVITTVAGAKGVRISELTAIGPKVPAGQNFNGIWLLSALNSAVEQCEVIDAHYSYWAQTGARFCTFTDVDSYNANVHYETTNATDITFRGMNSGDGDGDNQSGCEAVWHSLYASKRIRFIDGYHVGKGTPFEVVADATAGTDGVIRDIAYRNCRAINTDARLHLQIARLDGTVENVDLLDCHVIGEKPAGGDGQTGQIDIGKVTIRGGSFVNKNVNGISVFAGASLKTYDADFYMEGEPGSIGSFFSAQGKVSISGGSIKSPSATQGVFATNDGTSKNGTITQSTVVDLGGKPFPTDLPLGKVFRQVVTADLVFADGGFRVIPSADTRPTVESGAVYRYRARGRLRKTGTDGTVYVAQTPIAYGVASSGFIAVQAPDGSMVRTYAGEGRQPANANDVRQFEIDVTFVGTGGESLIGIGSDGVTLFAGAEISLERLA